VESGWLLPGPDLVGVAPYAQGPARVTQENALVIGTVWIVTARAGDRVPCGRIGHIPSDGVHRVVGKAMALPAYAACLKILDGIDVWIVAGDARPFLTDGVGMGSAHELSRLLLVAAATQTVLPFREKTLVRRRVRFMADGTRRFAQDRGMRLTGTDRSLQLLMAPEADPILILL
jgi:hypothetical protein